MNQALLILGMFVATFTSRYPPMVIAGRTQLPQPLLHLLKYVPIAVLTAIIVPEMFMPNDTLDISLNNAHLMAGMISIIVAWRTKNLLWTILLGMIVFLLLST
ncbi:MAG: branched-chain amino acid transport [Phototrophicales bacterium]|nr:MAG: branched-chain amino acid transport [Phototrophicales bacterium]